MAGPVFFHISPDCCGEKVLAELFRQSGHEVAFGEEGRLAEDILYAKGKRLSPLCGYGDVRLFAGLWRPASHWRGPLEAWREVAFLARAFPEAYFICGLRKVEDWLRDRWMQAGDATQWQYAGASAGAIADFWRESWHDHRAEVEAVLGNDPRLIRVDLDRETPAELAVRLSPKLPLTPKPDATGWFPPVVRAVGQIAAKEEKLDVGYVADVVRFCLGTSQPNETDFKATSGRFCHWDGRDAVTDREGNPRQIAVVAQADGGRLAVSKPGRHFKLLRAEAVINEALRLGRRIALDIDMEDSRWIGSEQGPAIGGPVLCHNRRAGARNAVLWPLPGQHDIGLPGFDPAAEPDRIAYEDKLDRIVWRGMISGSEMREGVRPGPASHHFLQRLEAAGGDAMAREEAWQGLCRTNRLRFIRRFRDHPDFDLGIVMAWGFRRFADDPLLAPYCGPRRGPAFFRRFRYQLCMAGYDHGSNFIPMIDSQSVMLKEEDGWEVFYSGRFTPWKHYIPLARYCADIEEKLAWARKNPNECKRMSDAARAEVAALRRPMTRQAIKAGILDGLARRG